MQKFQKLSKAEMKNVLGGKAAGQQCGYAAPPSCGVYDEGMDDCDNLNDCQDVADANCEKYDCCSNAYCKDV